ncbi:MAG TPA: CidA/LrgA family protein [Rhodocyclaceae bacterium]|nr:CidA/LrgA family protein [Rhodocyclaceae bacterium]
MLAALTLLLVFQLVGEVIALTFALPIPGPVIGLALLFLWLGVRGGPGPELQNTASGLLQHLSLLFVPAGTGVMLHLSRMADEWIPLTIALLASTVIGLLVTAGVMLLLAKQHAPEEPGA